MDVKIFEGKVSEYVDEGYIHVKMIFEIVGKPKKHIEGTMEKYIEQISKENDVVDYELHDTEKTKDGFFSSVSILEFLVKDLQKLFEICFKYMPSSIEILDPETLTFRNFELTSIVNTLQGNLHSIDFAVKKEKQNSVNISKNLNKLLVNFINYMTAENKGLDEISKATGVSQKDLKEIIEMHQEKDKSDDKK